MLTSSRKRAQATLMLDRDHDLPDPGSFSLCLLGRFALDLAGGFTLRLLRRLALRAFGSLDLRFLSSFAPCLPRRWSPCALACSIEVRLRADLGLIFLIELLRDGSYLPMFGCRGRALSGA